MGIYLAATYEGGTVSRNSNDESDFNAADAYAGYTFGDNNVNMTYNYFNADENSFNNLNVNMLAVEYSRYFGNATVYAAYSFNLLSDSDATTVSNGSANTEDELMVGLKYAF